MRDRFNRRACLLGFGLIYLVATLLSAVASGFWDLLMIRTLVAAGEACLLSVTVSLIADLLPPTKRPMGFAVFTAGVALMFFLSAVQELAQSTYRATATALLIIPDTIFGGGAGTFLTGLLSDLGSDRYGQESIRYALLLTIGVAWTLAALLYLRSSQSIERDAVTVSSTEPPMVSYARASVEP